MTTSMTMKFVMIEEKLKVNKSQSGAKKTEVKSRNSQSRAEAKLQSMTE